MLILIFLLGLVALVLAFALFVAVLQIVAGLVIIAVLAGAASIAVGAVVALLAYLSNPALDAPAWAAWATMLTFPFAAFVAGRWLFARWPGRRKTAIASVPIAGASVSAAPAQPQEPLPPISPKPAEPIAAAWWDAERLAPDQAARIADARKVCDAVLERAATHPLDWALTDCAAMIRRNLPDLVQSAIDTLAEGEPGVAADLIAALDDMAAEARQCIGPTETARERFAVLRTHLANRRRAAGV